MHKSCININSQTLKNTSKEEKTMNLKGRNFLTLKDYTEEEITYLLDLAAELKEKKKKGILVDTLKGKNVALIFEKTSTRTRCAFEVAAHDLGMGSTYLDPSGSQIGKKESIADTARVLGRMYEGIEYRGFGQEIVEELAACQKDNGGQWAASIPEKYLYWIGQKKPVWAPQYTIHKTFMGLLDMYELAGSKKALDVAVNFGKWFYDWSGKYTEAQFQEILDVETGGMLEIWVILYRITKDEMFRTLMDRYYRKSLFDGLLAGKDVLTNMHANTTIPEILGAAAAYEATGEQRYLDIAQAYWKSAVTDRGSYVTGGQTCGEIWSAPNQLKARLGDKTQEHCTVYNMMRLADFLFRHTISLCQLF